MEDHYKNDNELLYLYHQGDEEALTLLVKKYERIMQAYARRYQYRVKTSCDIQDIYQVTLIALFHAATTFKENMGCRFSSYFKIVMERAVHNYLRHIYSDMSRANKEAISMDQLVCDQESIYIIDTIPDNKKEVDPIYNLHINHIYLEIANAVKTFSKIEQEVYHLWVQGYSYREIGNLVSLKEKKVDNILQALKKKLRRLVDY